MRFQLTQGTAPDTDWHVWDAKKNESVLRGPNREIVAVVVSLLNAYGAMVGVQ